MLKRYGDKALKKSAVRAEELAAEDDRNGEAVWRRLTAAVGQLTNQNAARAAALTNPNSHSAAASMLIRFSAHLASDNVLYQT
jgi:hypothetical protein